jgi:hypothetical protein
MRVWQVIFLRTISDVNIKELFILCMRYSEQSHCPFRIDESPGTEAHSCMW